MALVILAVSGCSSLWGCTDTTAERGEAGVRVQVEDMSGRPLGVTAEVVDWRRRSGRTVPSRATNGSPSSTLNRSPECY
ncbi:hypothetical protein R1T08_03890 [Streptomyces sp. SBC-4]|nr:hypothetical protein [Streptomyces sp. SBC-4]MDV5143453.1 hypothetical protein [Streptomyces sp. SBC-4]